MPDYMAHELTQGLLWAREMIRYNYLSLPNTHGWKVGDGSDHAGEVGG